MYHGVDVCVCCVCVDVVGVGEVVCEFVDGEGCVGFGVCPEVGSRFVEVDHIREVDVFDAFGDDYFFAAYVVEAESWFEFHKFVFLKKGKCGSMSVEGVNSSHGDGFEREGSREERLARKVCVCALKTAGAALGCLLLADCGRGRRGAPRMAAGGFAVGKITKIL